MTSKYPPSVRGCLPLWALALQAASILIFFFFTFYDSSVDQKMLLTVYKVFQDVIIMAALGFGFLTSSLRRHGWSSVAFNLFLLALGVQWTILLDAFLKYPYTNVVITLSSIQEATMSAMCVLISAGAVLGKVNLVQLVVMALMEVASVVAANKIYKDIFDVTNHIRIMHVHVFGAYFGLSVAWSFHLPNKPEEKEQIATSPSLFSMLGTLFLWIFWPSFNSALLEAPDEKKNAVFNTYYALAVSAVTAISVSALAHPKGKLNMNHIHNAVLAGGVAVGAPGHLILFPSVAMILGLVAGLISLGGAKCLPVCLNRVLRIHDAGGVHSTFGLPGLLGGVIYIVLMMLEVSWIGNSMINHQLVMDIGALSLAVAMALTCGLLTGLLLNFNIWKAPHMDKDFFDDQAFWERILEHWFKAMRLKADVPVSLLQKLSRLYSAKLLTFPTWFCVFCELLHHILDQAKQ
ncbi:PREDICTED: RH-like protein IC [Elephantulus edwardii]|uniref:RH-like protein IC n=1 Tax=Elephantulus edwardii TaxID=28737 RepID=UPI0003F08758|nr:PREDICTED: RH-like protein IC [Elephantulus edwardii]